MDLPRWLEKQKPKKFDSWDKEQQEAWVEARRAKKREIAERARAKDPEGFRLKLNAANRKSYEKHREVRCAKNRENNKRIYWADPQKFREKARIDRLKNPEKYKQRDRDAVVRAISRDPKYYTNKWKRALKKRPELGVKNSLSCRLNYLLRKIGGGKKGKSVLDFIGCSLDQLKEHVESRFRDGMAWENWGSVWELDHIKPCAAFDHRDPQQVAECWHYTNYQPLLVVENREKSDKIIPE